MDAGVQAELAELRRRAFGVHPDIEGDSAATVRLIELEGIVLVEHAASVSALIGEYIAADAAPASGLVLREAPVLPPAPTTDAAGSPEAVDTLARARRIRARRRGGWTVAAAAALIATAVVVATPAEPPAPAESGVTIESAKSAYGLTRDLDSTVLLEIPFGPWIDTRASDTDIIWLFPTTDQIEWTALLGEYYGWDIWIGGTDDKPEKQHCLLAVHGQVGRARCIPAALRPFSALVVTLPYKTIQADERPLGFAPDQRIGFWWRADDSVTVMLAYAPEER